MTSRSTPAVGGKERTKRGHVDIEGGIDNSYSACSRCIFVVYSDISRCGWTEGAVPGLSAEVLTTELVQVVDTGAFHDLRVNAFRLADVPLTVHARPAEGKVEPVLHEAIVEFDAISIKDDSSKKLFRAIQHPRGSGLPVAEVPPEQSNLISH